MNRSSSFRREAEETKHKQANWQAQCFLTHFPKESNCEVCELTKTTKPPCRNRPDARGDSSHLPQIFGAALSADQNVLNEENESRLQHRGAVVVQDLHSELVQSYPTINKKQRLKK